MTVLENYKMAKSEFRVAVDKLDDARTELREEIVRVYHAYIPHKNKLSTRKWPVVSWFGSSLNYKIKGRWIQVHVRQHIQYGAHAEYYWRFPASWLELTEPELLSEINLMLVAETEKHNSRQLKQNETRKAKLLEELKQIEKELENV